MSVQRVHRIVTGGKVNVGGTGATCFAQPRSFVDFSEADRGVNWILDVLGTEGTADSWYLTVKAQFGHPDVGRAQYGFGKFRWFDLQSEQIAKFFSEGVDWYGGVVPPSTQQNLHPNPSVETASSGWSADNGTGGASTASRPTDGGYSRDTYYRVTFSTAPTSLGGLKTASAQVVGGSTYSAGVWVRPSKTMNLRCGIDWYDSGSTLLSTVYGSATNCPAGVWTRVTAPAKAAPATATTAKPRVTTGGGSTWAAGDVLDADAVMMNAGATLFDFFDGASSGAVWDGSADASTSTRTVAGGPSAGQAGIVARSTDALPITVSRLVLGSRMLERLWIQPYAVNPSADFGVFYSLAAEVG